MRRMERQGYLEQVPDSTDTRAKVVRMTKRGEEVKTACVEVREELRKVAGALGEKEAGRLQASLDAAAGQFGEIAEASPQQSDNPHHSLRNSELSAPPHAVIAS